MKTKIYFLLVAMMLGTMAYGQGSSLVQLPKASAVQPMQRVQRVERVQRVQAVQEQSAQKVQHAQQISTINVGVAISIGTKLELGSTSTEQYCVEGWVVNAESYNPKKGSQTWWMSTAKDNAIGQLFEAYQCLASENGQPMQVINGDYVRLTGYLTYYNDVANNRAYVEIKNGTAEFVSKETGDHSLPTIDRISVATALAKGAGLSGGSYTTDTYEIVGYVSALDKTNSSGSTYQSFWITDDPSSTASSNANKAFYVYKSHPQQTVKVGDLVTVQSRVYRYTTGVIETETAAPVSIASPIVIECSDNSVGYEGYNDDVGYNWYIWGLTGSYYICLDVFCSNTSSPAGTYTFADGQYYTDYTGKSDGDNWVSHATDGWASVTENTNGLYVLATLIMDDGNIYVISFSKTSSGTVVTPDTITIHCDPEAYLTYDFDDKVWYINGVDDTHSYHPSFLVSSTNTTNPTGTYSGSSIIKNYTGLQDNNAMKVTATDAELEIWFAKSAYYASGWFTGTDGNRYEVTMTCPVYPVIVRAKLPDGAPKAGVAMWAHKGVGGETTISMDHLTDGNWFGSLENMQAYDAFNFHELYNTGNRIMQNGDKEWTNLADISFLNVWQDGTGDEKGTKVVTLDYSDAKNYKWTVEQPATPTYTVSIYAPTPCDEVPALVGDFNSWDLGSPAVMTPMVDADFNVYYTYTFTDEAKHAFRIIAAPAQGESGSWDNQLMQYNAKDKAWVEAGNYTLGDETTIQLDCSDWTQYRFGKCTDDDAFPIKKVLVAIKLPEVVPVLGAEIIGSFNNWLQNATDVPVYMEAYTQMEGVYYAIVQAKANDCFKIRQAKSWNNEILVNGQELQCEDLIFGKLWYDASVVAALVDPQFASLADKAVYLDWSDAKTYAWRSIPKTIYIDCGSNFTWTYYSKGNDWMIQAQGYAGQDPYTVYVDAYAKDLTSPLGSYSSDNNDFDMEKTLIIQKNDDTEITIEKAEATVMLTDGVISAVGTFIGADNNIYVVTMAMDMPSPKKEETITATNLRYFSSSDCHLFYATDGYSSVEIDLYPVTKSFTGTHAIGENLRITVRQGNDLYNMVSGSITISTSEDEQKCYVNGEVLGYNSVLYKLQLATHEPSIGATTLRILVPTDNNMDTTNGVWVWWWLTGGDGHIVQTQSLGGHWYEAQFEVDAPSFNFLVVNRNVLTHANKWSGAHQTTDYMNVTAAQSCYELAYNNGNAKWDLYEMDCAAQDHDYRYQIEFDNSVAGLLFITLNAKELAPGYEIGFRPAGSTDGYSYRYWLPNGEYWSVRMPFDIKQDTQFEIALYGYKYNLSRESYFPVTGITYETITVKANPNVPDKLNAAVNNEKVTFSWQPNGTASTYYKIEAYNKNGTLCYLSDLITSTTVTGSIYATGEYIWYLDVYDADGQMISNPQGENFTITSVPDLKPNNLKVSVEGKVATLTWETPSPADETLLQIYFQTDPYIPIVKELINTTTGKYSYSYTFDEEDKRELKWMLVSYIKDNNYYYSEQVFGEPFRAEIAHYNLQISAGEGGTVNEAVNGTYEEGAKVTIIATPNSGYEFSKWSDQKEDKVRMLTMNRDWELVAMFKKIGSSSTPATTYTLSVSSAGGGTVNKEVSGTYEKGEVVSITAKPLPDWTFDKWSDNNIEPTRLITITQDSTLIAYFKTTKKFKVTISAGAGGTVTPEINGKEYAGGETIEVDAKANSGYAFSKWSDDNVEAKRTIFVDRDLNLTATFIEATQCTLRVEIEPREGAGTVLFDGENVSSMRKVVSAGTTVTLTVKAASGYSFVRFEDGEDRIYAKEYDVTVKTSKTVTAVFRKDEEGLDQTNEEMKKCGNEKILYNGRIYILRGEHVYTVEGQLVE